MSSTSLPFPMIENVAERFTYDQFDDFIGEGKFGNVYIAIDNDPHYLRNNSSNQQRVIIDENGNNTGNLLTNQVDASPPSSQPQTQQARVALKVVEKYKLENAKAFADIVSEVELARRVDHPNCVRVLDAVHSEDRIFIVQELIEGSDLQVLVSSQRGLPEPLVQAMAAQLLYALSYLHKNNLVHRDVKPENVMLSGDNVIPVIGDDSRDLFDGSLKQDQYLDAARLTLVDFGLAKSLPKSHHNTNANSSSSSIAPSKKPRVQVGGGTNNNNTAGVSSLFKMTSTTTNKVSSLPRDSQQQQNNQNQNQEDTKCDPDIGSVASSPQLSQESLMGSAQASTVSSTATQHHQNNNNQQQPSSPTTNPSKSIGLFPMINNVDAAACSSNSNNNNNNFNDQQSSSYTNKRQDSVGSSHSSTSSSTNNNNNNPTHMSLPRQSSVQSLTGGGTNSPMVMTPCGTFGFSAPELMRHLAHMGVNHKQQTNRQEVYKRDIYSVGLVLFYAFVGKTPFNVRTAAALAKQMESGPSYLGPMWDKISTDAKNFISILLTNQPDARPSADIAMAHPWISPLVQKLKAKYNNNNSMVNQSSSSNTSSSNDQQQQQQMMLSSSSNSDQILTLSRAGSMDNNNNSGTTTGFLPLRRKNNGRSYDDLTALHSLRASEAQEFDAICFANDENVVLSGGNNNNNDHTDASEDNNNNNMEDQHVSMD